MDTAIRSDLNRRRVLTIHSKMEDPWLSVKPHTTEHNHVLRVVQILVTPMIDTNDFLLPPGDCPLRKEHIRNTIWCLWSWRLLTQPTPSKTAATVTISASTLRSFPYRACVRKTSITRCGSFFNCNEKKGGPWKATHWRRRSPISQRLVDDKPRIVRSP